MMALGQEPVVLVNLGLRTDSEGSYHFDALLHPKWWSTQEDYQCAKACIVRVLCEKLKERTGVKHKLGQMFEV
jgi:hypothetical protein